LAKNGGGVYSMLREFKTLRTDCFAAHWVKVSVSAGTILDFKIRMEELVTPLFLVELVQQTTCRLGQPYKRK